MPDRDYGHPIDIDQEPYATDLGFTSANGFIGGYLWFRPPRTIYIPLIVCEKHGEFGKMCQSILARGYTIKLVEIISPRLLEIATKNGYQHTMERDPMIGEDVDVWVREPKHEQEARFGLWPWGIPLPTSESPSAEQGSY